MKTWLLGIALVCLGVLVGCVQPVQSSVDGPWPAVPSQEPTPTAVAWDVIPVTPTPSVEQKQRSYRNTPRLARLLPAPANPNRGCFKDGCHASMLQETGEYIHAPFAAGTCRPCHDVEALQAPHDQPHQASEQDIALCYDCHPPETLGNSHPVDEGRIDPRTGGAFTCTSTCHDPHAGPYPGLMRFPPGGELCVLCHQEFGQ